MKSRLKNFPLLLAFALLSTGCAIGNQYSYESTTMVLPVRGTAAVGLAVIDQRPYVLDGDKTPDFVGLQRGGFGNPFDVKTQSGKPLSVDMQNSLSKALEANGYQVTLLQPASASEADMVQAVRQEGKSRNVILLLKEWKTDAMMRFGISYDVVLSILNEHAEPLAENSLKADKEAVGGAGFEGANSKAASMVFENKMNVLFNSPAVIQAME
jgi:hypothetical protein